MNVQATHVVQPVQVFVKIFLVLSDARAGLGTGMRALLAEVMCLGFYSCEWN